MVWIFIATKSADSGYSVSKILFWSWFFILLILNVIPLGNETNQRLNVELFSFRLDYLVHATSVLVFAWILLLVKVLGFRSFKVSEFTILVFVCAVGFELIQFFIPWRTFNPVDMAYNVFGACIATLFNFVSQQKLKKG